MYARTAVLCCFAALTVLGADDPWEKVKALQSGQELRIVRRDSKQPVLAKMDEASADALVVVVRDQQVSIAKDQIDRIDARPAQRGSRVTSQTTTTTTDARITGPATQMNGGGVTRGGVNSSSGVSIGGKPDFELVYRRSIGAPQPMSAQQK